MVMYKKRLMSLTQATGIEDIKQCGSVDNRGEDRLTDSGIDRARIWYVKIDKYNITTTFSRCTRFWERDMGFTTICES